MSKDKGIVIDAKIYRNTSQLIKIFLKNNGFVLGYAKGIYKMKKFDFDGPFKTFFEYEVEIRGDPVHNDIVLLTSSKCISAIDYIMFDRLLFFKKIQDSIEFIFMPGYKDVATYNFFRLSIHHFSKLQKPQFLHYAYFVCNILRLLGLLNYATLN
ncbi:MAG: recombination protein O N-terminal domain-containing protein, partial [Planctomycetota bacterium]